MIVQPAGPWLVSETVLLGDCFGGALEDAFVELRELSAIDMSRLQKALASADEVRNVEAFGEILPRIIVDHNIGKDETTKYSPEELRDLIMSKAEAYYRVLRQYSEKVLFTQGKRIAAS